MKSQPKWLQAVGATQEAVYVVNDARRIVCWNAGAQRLLGFQESEVLHHPCYQVIGGRVYEKAWCHAECAVQRFVKRGILLQTFEMQALTREKEEVWLGVSVFVIERRGKRFTVHLLRNMTREEQTKEVLEKIIETLDAYCSTSGSRRSVESTSLVNHASSPKPPSLEKLTRREIQVLRLLAQGLSTKDLAQKLGVSPFTVRSHIESILFKTGVHTQAQAVAYAYRAGLF